MSKNYKYDVIYICDWLPPDFGAVGQYCQLFSRRLAENNQRVVLIGLTSSASSDVSQACNGGHLRTIKIAAKLYKKTSRIERLFWTVKTNTRLLISALPFMRKSRKVIFTGSPPLFLHWIAPANVFMRKHLVYRITDFHPECAIAERGKRSFLLASIYYLTLFWRQQIDMFEVLGHDQAERLQSIGIRSDRIQFKPDPSPIEIPACTKPIARPLGAKGKRLLLYSGNWGVAHDHETFLAAYARHHRCGQGNVILWLNAVGARTTFIENYLTNADLPFIRGAPVPLSELAALLVTPDIHLITLSDPFVGYVLPSKVHGCIASKRSILFIGSARSDVHRLCTEQVNKDFYFRVDVGDVEGCELLLDRLGEPCGLTPRELQV